MANMRTDSVFQGWEPQRVFNWELLIPFDTETIAVAVESVRFPQISTDVIPLRYQNEDVKYAGGAKVGENQMSVRDFVKPDVYAILNKWMEMVHTPADGQIHYKTTYAKQCTLNLLDPEGTPSKTFTCINVWPSTLTGSEGLTYNNTTGIVHLAMTLQVDKYLV